MDNDEAFLRAIADNPADNAPRLIYADWLDERGDSRAEFLRVQSALGKQTPDKSTFRKLCKREQYLVGQLDSTWVQRVRRYTTAAPCRDMAILVPDLAPFARTTTRLHPHRAAGPLPVWVSKIGGRFLWPTTEPWPSCEQCGVDLTPILQLRRSDVPDFDYPPGTDLFQLFWCPDEAAHDYQPAPRVWWRATATITRSRADDPDLSGFPRISDWQGYIPFECSVCAERVIEYPFLDDLYALAGSEEAARINELVENIDVGSTADLGDRFTSDDGGLSDAHSLAFYELGQCPGTKVGGKPGFVRDGREFDHLVTLSTWEFSAGSFRRWLAVEDQRMLAPPGEVLTWRRLSEHAAVDSLREVLGMQLGRTQRVHLFICRDREPWQILAYVND
jgi:uncharacterized protein (TIGR02996 family)